MRALVTGGAGFIGSHLVDALLARGDEVTVLDHLGTGNVDNLRHNLTRPDFRFINDTVLDAPVVDRWVESVDIVYHLAAAVGVWHIVNDPLWAITTNVQGTENVLRAAYRHWKKVVTISSSEVYGKSTKVPLAEDDDRVLGPTSVTRWNYSSSKAIDEHFAYAYADKGLPVTILRFFNSYGPRIHSAGYGTVVARFIRQALNHEPLTVHGDGQQTRCFCYVDDTVRGVLLAGDKSEANGEAFNIGNDQEIRMLDLAVRIKELTHSQSKIKLVPYEDFYGQRFEDTPRRVPDLRKARRVLGYRTDLSLDEGLRRTIAWCRENNFAGTARRSVASGE
jgi:UDP-glucose 4-epimerase